MLESQGDAKAADKYVFPFTATMITEEIKNGKVKNSYSIKQGYGENAVISESADSPDPSIIDFENQSVILLNIKEGTAQLMSLTWMQKMMGNQNDEVNEDEVKITKTGNTKTILGYRCEEYIITHEDSKSNIWFTKEVDFDYTDYMSGFAKLFKGKMNYSKTLTENYGYMMEMEYFEKGSKSMTMRVTDISNKTRMITMSNFKIQKMF